MIILCGQRPFYDHTFVVIELLFTATLFKRKDSAIAMKKMYVKDVERTDVDRIYFLFLRIQKTVASIDRALR